jgi:cytochrome c oxidase subunit 2
MNELLRRLLFLPPQASTVAREIDYLHYFVILTTMGGAALITVVGLVFTVRYRARRAIAREQPGGTPPLWLELGVVGMLLGLFCLWWVIGFLEYVHVRVAPENAMTVQVTAKQWMWKFAYPDGQGTVSTLYVPTGRPVRLLLTSRDVVHSFFVPDFRVKYDAVPGRYTSLWFQVTAPGTHQVFCAEYCGVGHSTMRAQVVALSPEDYARWAAGARRDEEPSARVSLAGPRPDDPMAVQGAAPAELLSLVRVGEQVAAQQGCLRCHTLDGTPHIGPTWAGLYHAVVPVKNAPPVIADEAYLTESMMDPLAKIHDGYAPVMPSYHGLLSPAETAAIIQLIKAVAPVPGRPEEARAAPIPVAGPPPAGRIGQVLTAPAGLRAVPGRPPQLEEGLPLPGAQREPPPVGRIEASEGGTTKVVPTPENPRSRP